MNSQTLIVFILLLVLFALAIRHAIKSKGSCTDCGLSGNCPIKDLRRNVALNQCKPVQIQKLKRSGLRGMIRR
ncbi:hypothetical protein [Sporolactobacillus terrae]|uniref:FeoB-associated Cys-rich membrane protein n=1 Tax=Sporolactobacillus terrae TaxID=269673 RepID=A0A5K7WZ73_9BACL|nr:hypothetical protein [Sporolactobacillus terrae]BBN99029.1 hypothetical protein St703_17340 [Sporolactobacillus terrae]